MSTSRDLALVGNWTPVAEFEFHMEYTINLLCFTDIYNLMKI